MSARERMMAYLAERAAASDREGQAKSFENLREVVESMNDSDFEAYS